MKFVNHIWPRHSFWLLALCLPFLITCIDLYDPKIEDNVDKIVVDGLITDQPGPYTVRLLYSSPYNNNNIYELGRFPQSARVFVFDDTGFEEELTHTGSGYYRTQQLQGQIGRTYTLRIQTIEGGIYQSKPELLKPTTSIDTIYSEYRQLQGVGIRGELAVFLDAQDPATPEDYYRWSWKHYKMVDFCRFYTSAGEPPSRFSQPCCEPCWDIVFDYGVINVASDFYINGKTISRQPVTTVPYNSKLPYYLEVQQFSLTKDAHRFWSVLKEQANATGGIFDTPPATIPGNIYNIQNPEEEVLGFFGASAVTKKIVFIRRDRLPEPPFFSDNSVYTPVNQCAPCNETARRTRQKPEGWD